MKNIIENRREFLGRSFLAAGAVPALFHCRHSSHAQQAAGDKLEQIRKNAVQDPNCEWCGARDVPDDVRWKASLVKDGDPGERLIVSGTVYQPDGKTPAPDVLLYFYHTDTEGLYGRRGQHRHGRYRNWVLTDDQGRYSFYTIKPAHYPSRGTAAHIHMTLTDRDRKEDWIDTVFFEGDPLVTSRNRVISKGGFEHVLKLEKDAEGILRGTRDIQLEKI